ncbi:hypothetical protein BUY35_11635 [Staphylococcus cohnii]|nr:hypothetical protein [Staphylococcus sp. GDY8P73P]RIM27682.1 hypothetical protein BUY35_11635 [Staphylococcus cohnii]
MDYAQQLERIEEKKSKERMAVKKQGVDRGPQVKERMATNKKGTVPGPYAKKSKDRRSAKLKQHKNTVTDQGPERKGETRDIVGKASGFGSGRTYARAKYIYENGMT